MGFAFEFTAEQIAAHCERLVPENLRFGFMAHLLLGSPAGHFVEAVLRNDLMLALGTASPDSAAALKDIAAWLYNYVPRQCRGSDESVREWRRSGGMVGLGAVTRDDAMAILRRC